MLYHLVTATALWLTAVHLRGDVEALSTTTTTTSPSSSRRQFIELTNPLKPSATACSGDRLPAAFVAEWSTWVLETDDSWSRIPDDSTVLAASKNVGGSFVNAVSMDELWQAADLKAPECRLAVGLHVRNGAIRHVLPAVDLSFPAAPSPHQPPSCADVRQHRNRGLCTVPRAYRWMDFAAYMAGTNLRLRLQTRNHRDGDAATNEERWTTVLQFDSIASAIHRAITAMADEPPTALGEGSSIVHVVVVRDPEERVAIEEEEQCSNTVLLLPGISELRVLLYEEDDEDGDDDTTPVGALQVRVVKTMAGSKSEHLPDAYRPLFENASLRREAYTEANRSKHYMD